MAPDADGWYTTKEVAALLGNLSAQAVLNAAKDGRLTGWRRSGTGPRASYQFPKAKIDALDGQMPGGRRRDGDRELVQLIDRLRHEVTSHQIERALAEQRITALEREVDRLQSALRDVVRRFTAPEIPDAPGA